MTLFQHHILALLLTALSVLGLGLLVFFAGPKRRLNQIFGLYSLAIFWWSYSELFMVTASDPMTATFWSRMEWAGGAIFIGPTFLHTVLLLVGNMNKSNVLIRVAYGLSIVFLVLHSFDLLLITPAKPFVYLPYFTTVTIFGAMIPLVFLVLVNIGLWRLARAYRQERGLRRTQLKYLFWASLLGYLGGSPNWLPSYGLYIPYLNPFGIYSVSLYSIAIVYAVFQHQLFDVHLIVRKSLAYSLLVTLLTIGYFGFVYVVERSFSITFGYQSIWVSVAAFALMAVLFQPLKIGVQKMVDLWFFRAPQEELIMRMERLEQEVRHADKLKAVSTLAAGMAHEIKNPLTSLKTFTAYLTEKGTDPAFQQKFQRVVTQEVDKIDQIVRRLLEFAKPASPRFEAIKISRLLDETLDFLNSEALHRRIEIERTYRDVDAIQADPQQLRQVFLNLFLNSFEAMNGSGGNLLVMTAKTGSSVTVTIKDSGHGIPKEYLTRVFDPFFTTKSTGTGLGLSIVQGIVAEHSGTIVFESKPNHGTTCTLTFPLR